MGGPTRPPPAGELSGGGPAPTSPPGDLGIDALPPPRVPPASGARAPRRQQQQRARARWWWWWAWRERAPDSGEAAATTDTLVPLPCGAT
uniref:Uncharacterized protein n=1 Tax=Oryza rufipogon TaxID=4529 RepID=A0A0E0QAR4_ORYRU